MTTVTTEPGSTTAQAGDTTTATTAPDAEASASTTGEGQGQEGQTSAPASVDYTFELPEGIAIDQARNDAFVALAKEANLPKDVAQKIVGMEAARIQAEADAHIAMVKGWADSLTADKELGVPENQAIAKGVIDTFGSPELKAFLNESGLGNHPELVKLAFKVGKALSEDSMVRGGQGAQGEQTTAKKMFPTMN
jgi:hypothetical protein